MSEKWDPQSKYQLAAGLLFVLYGFIWAFGSSVTTYAFDLCIVWGYPLLDFVHCVE
jgi:hypothetical protein